MKHKIVKKILNEIVTTGALSGQESPTSNVVRNTPVSREVANIKDNDIENQFKQDTDGSLMYMAGLNKKNTRDIYNKLVQKDKSGKFIYLAGKDWKQFDYNRGFNDLIKKDKTGQWIYEAGKKWKEFNHQKGLVALIKTDRTRQWIYLAGKDWKRFDYKLGWKVIKNSAHYKKAKETWPNQVNESSGLEKAEKYAERQHKGVYRKFSGEPYVKHPKRVADLIKKYKKSHQIDNLVKAALLHDTIEDTDTTSKDLKKMFNGLVASLVNELSSNKEDMENAGGKRKYLANKMINMSNWGLVIKLADRLDNVSDLKDGSEEFRKKYTRETRFILNQLKQKRKLTGTQKRIIAAIEVKLLREL